MALKNFVGESAGNTAKTHDLDVPTGASVADFKSLTISIIQPLTKRDFGTTDSDKLL